MSIVFALSAAIICLLLATLHWRRRKMQQRVSRIPAVKGQIPLFGISHRLIGAELKDYVTILLRFFDENEPMQKLWFATKLAIVLSRPEQFKTIFASPHCVNKPLIIYDGFFSKFGLISLNGDTQDKHRRILSNAMTPTMLHQLNPIFNEKAKQLVKKLSEKVSENEFNVYNHVAACTLEALMKGQFQHDHDCYESEVIEAFENSKDIMMRRMAQPWMSFEPLYRISQLAKDAKRVFAPIHKKVEEIINVNQRLKTVNEQKAGVLISQLLNLKNNFCDDEIRDEIFIWIFGGYETTAVTLSTCILLLAMHKDIQQKVIDEISDANLDEHFTISNDETQNFPYIEMVLKETMRLFPVAPLILRETTAEVELEGHAIPEGTILAMPIYLVHRSERIWGSDAKLFNPERFEAEKIAKIHPYAFVPFSGGKRMCLGHKYAMIFMKIFIVNFFKSFEVDTSLKLDELEIQLTPTLGIVQGYQVSVKERVEQVVKTDRVQRLIESFGGMRESFSRT